jgi:phenylalanyl-tRNA synthetase alpha chain
MQNLDDKISKIKNEFETLIKKSSNLKTLESIRISFLGKKGHITLLMGELKALPTEEKKIFGPLLNNLKKHAEDHIEKKKKELIVLQAEQSVLKKKNFDVSAYRTKSTKGHLHPYSLFLEEVENIFISMGYEICDGPELISEYYNFTALNIPKNHPARDMHDTLWSNKIGMLLRTHTSNVQIKAMETKELPLAIVAPGRVFRHESLDASHDMAFMQCEGVFIDKNVNLSHLFATVQTFLKALFKKDELDIRIRPGFFPFVEPGMEIDMRCPFCKDGCSVCKKTTWVEVFPGGLIHPNVLKFGGIDPEKYSGFAFGFGFSRLAMLKYEIDDIRLFYSGKMKFLEQF